MQDLAGAGVLQYKTTRSAQRRWPCGSVPMTWTSSPLSCGDYSETECSSKHPLSRDDPRPSALHPLLHNFLLRLPHGSPGWAAQ